MSPPLPQIGWLSLSWLTADRACKPFKTAFFCHPERQRRV
jgi:hypothetical protein